MVNWKILKGNFRLYGHIKKLKQKQTKAKIGGKILQNFVKTQAKHSKTIFPIKPNNNTMLSDLGHEKNSIRNSKIPKVSPTLYDKVINNET